MLGVVTTHIMGEEFSSIHLLSCIVDALVYSTIATSAKRNNEIDGTKMHTHAHTHTHTHTHTHQWPTLIIILQLMYTFKSIESAEHI